MDKRVKIYVSGHTGLLGSAIVRLLKEQGFRAVITRTKQQLDLTDQRRVATFFARERPQYVIHAAARVGGLAANIRYPAEFLYENIMIDGNVIHQAYRAGVNRLLAFGSNCFYPRRCSQPMQEKHLLAGSLEPTNEAYAIAKIAGVKLCENYNRQYGKDFFAVVPASFYGPSDHFANDRSRAHMIPLLLRALHNAKKQGAKTVRLDDNPHKIREFTYVDDVARACLHLMAQPRAKRQWRGRSLWLVNLGTAQPVSVRTLAETAAKVIGYSGRITWATNQPPGMPAKVLDGRKIKALGWRPITKLEDGLRHTYEWFIQHHEELL